MTLPSPYVVEQKISKQVTVNAGLTGTVTLPMPSGFKCALKGYGYTWYTLNTYTLNTDNICFPTRTDQEGSASIPRIFENSFPIKSGGNLTFTIVNGDASNHTYDVTFYIYSDQLLTGTAYNSQGGELIITTGSGASTGAVILYNSAVTIAANVSTKGLEVDPQSPATLLCGTKTTSTAAALAIAASTACKKVTVQAATTNADIIYVGNATVQLIELDAGQSIDITCDNLVSIYVKRSGSTNLTVNYIGS